MIEDYEKVSYYQRLRETVRTSTHINAEWLAAGATPPVTLRFTNGRKEFFVHWNAAFTMSGTLDEFLQVEVKLFEAIEQALIESKEEAK